MKTKELDDMLFKLRTIIYRISRDPDIDHNEFRLAEAVNQLDIALYTLEELYEEEEYGG